ncbi:hypothetical protein PIROE2DRAFT_58811 [Piromyces sp. E2]|nr:hypothetical protein PIROE2DRAFT_58811 [Piromyces sp. E2]|eukprot:OUM67433.1 hypothetical protein PIROE2DRAFT_58811 [Piromyces sp. E2]
MSKRLKFTPIIVILLLVNVFLITLYHHTQINRGSEVIEDNIISNNIDDTSIPILNGPINVNENKEKINELEKANESKILKEDENTSKDINKTENKNDNEKINETEKISENEIINKENSIYNRINDIKQKNPDKILNDNYKYIKDKINMKDKAILMNKVFNNESKYWEKHKDYIGRFRNKSKENVKNKSTNGVDDTNEFRSLKPFYENLTQKKIIEDYYDPNKMFWKDVKFGEFPFPSLSNISNRTEYRNLKNTLYADAVNSICNEQDKQNKRISYDDERELRFLLKYARDVENGLRHDELEPEWQWASDISIVYTWVNGSDPIHLAQKAKYNGGIKKTPEWLDPEFDRIEIINQEDILPKKDMNGNDVNPTFNSNAIEWFLDKIPGLTEQFIQLNDDYFFNHPVHPSYFFYGGGESYEIDEDFIKYFNKKQEIKNNYPYYYYKHFKRSQQYKMTSKLNYSKYLANRHLINELYPCLQTVIDGLEEKEPYEYINERHTSCINRAIEIANYKENEIEDVNQNIIVQNNGRKEEDMEDMNEEAEEEVQGSRHSKRYEYKPKTKEIFFPNAAQHFRFPNMYLALHFLINDMQHARNVGRKSFSQTTMTDRYFASLGMTNGAIKSIYGRYVRTNQLEHGPYVWYRDLYPMSREKFKNFINVTLTHKFRHPEDVIPPFANQAYIRYTASKKGFEEIFDKFHSSKYVHDLDEEVVGNKKNKEAYLFFNFNDDYSEPRVGEELHEIMEFLFPDKGIFEK